MNEPTLNEIFETLTTRQKENIYGLVGSILKDKRINLELYNECVGSLDTNNQVLLVKHLVKKILEEVNREVEK